MLGVCLVFVCVPFQFLLPPLPPPPSSSPAGGDVYMYIRTCVYIYIYMHVFVYVRQRIIFLLISAGLEYVTIELKRQSRESDDALAAAVSGNEHLRLREFRGRFLDIVLIYTRPKAVLPRSDQ